jgi:hypothetical protein
MVLMSVSSDLDGIAQRQWGLVSRVQALELMSPQQLRRRCASAALVPVHRGVFRLAGAPLSWRQRAMACCLAYGSPVAVSHRAAARLWGLEGILAREPEVTVPPGRNGKRSGIVTHRAPLLDVDMTTRHGIPVTTAARTLADLAAVLSPYLLERVLDQAGRSRLVTMAELAARQASLVGPGRRGHANLRELLSFRLERAGFGDSEWADRAWRWIVDAGVEPPDRQVAVIAGGVVRVLDMAYVPERIAIEFAGFDHHGRRHRFDSDADRTADLQLAGWLVLPVTSRHSKDRFVDRVRQALALRRGEPSVWGT